MINRKTSPKNFKDKTSKQQWYIFYTNPRAEKVVYQDLLRAGYNTFLPLIRTLKTWKNRQKKWIESPLFPNYIFVRTYNSELYNIVKIPKICTYIHFGGKAATISDTEIYSIKKILGCSDEISVDTHFYEGQRVRIVHGSLKGHEGVLVNKNGKTKFGVQLSEINHTVLIDATKISLTKL